jgi:hypothetical protein
MRGAINGQSLPMMEILVTYGADENAEWNGDLVSTAKSLREIDTPLRQA